MRHCRRTAVAFRLVNVKTGKALDVKDGSMRAGAALVQSPVSDRPSQLWTVRSAQDSLLIVNAHSGHSINIPRKSNTNRQPLIQWTVAEGEPNQSLGLPQRQAGVPHRLPSEQPR